MKHRYNYTFNDVLELLASDSFNTWTNTGSAILKDIIEDVVSSSVMASLSEIGTLSGGTLTYASHIASLLDNIYRLHEENYCVFVDFESQRETESKRFLIKFLTLINQTAPRYKKLLDLYTSQATHLLDGLSTSNSGLVKFNDTPQGSGDFADDTHTTNITKTSSSTQTDVRTPMEKLKEIQDSYSDLLAKWSEEISVMFLEEGNFAYEGL